MIVFTHASRVLMTMQDDGDRAKMTNGSGVWRLPGCHTPDELPALQPFFITHNSIHILLSSPFFLIITQTKFFSLILFLTYNSIHILLSSPFSHILIHILLFSPFSYNSLEILLSNPFFLTTEIITGWPWSLTSKRVSMGSLKWGYIIILSTFKQKM